MIKITFGRLPSGGDSSEAAQGLQRKAKAMQKVEAAIQDAARKAIRRTGDCTTIAPRLKTKQSTRWHGDAYRSPQETSAT
jgi:hypothetical protein